MKRSEKSKTYVSKNTLELDDGHDAYKIFDMIISRKVYFVLISYSIYYYG